METKYSEIHRLYPQMSVKVKVTSRTAEDERFHLVCAGSAAQIEAASSLMERFALSQLLAGLQSNRLGEVVGENSPQFRIRPLWLQEGQFYTQPDGLMLFLPSWVACGDSQVLDGYIKEIIDCGYNTLIFASKSSDEKSEPQDLCIIQRMFDQIRKSGLKIALGCSLQHEEIETYWQKIAVFQESSDYIFWNQDDLYALGFVSAKKDQTPCERALEELLVLQRECRLPIFYHTKSLCPFLLPLLQAVSKKSVLSFDAYSKGVLHPVFTDLARFTVEEPFSLLPILEVSQIELVNGQVFSDCPFSEIENVLGRQKRDRFFGAGCRTASVRRASSLSQMPLWIIGQRMWRISSVQALTAMWLDRFYPEWHVWLTPEVLQAIHMLFRYKAEGNVEKAVKVLVGLAETLSGYRNELRFKKYITSLKELSQLLHFFQTSLKAVFEQELAKKMLKIPLSLQNFTSVDFTAPT